MRILSLFALLFTTSCGVQEVKELGHDVSSKPFLPKHSDNRFDSYISKYEKEMNIKIGFPIVFVDYFIDSDIAGQCSLNWDKSRIVRISEESWNNPHELYKDHIEVFRELIMYHELKHCASRFKYHVNSYKTFIYNNEEVSEPESIMNSFIEISPEFYLDNREYYIKQLKELWFRFYNYSYNGGIIWRPYI